MQATINAEYNQFNESVNDDEKEQILIQIKHKAAEGAVPGSKENRPC